MESSVLGGYFFPKIFIVNTTSNLIFIFLIIESMFTVNLCIKSVWPETKEKSQKWNMIEKILYCQQDEIWYVESKN